MFAPAYQASADETSNSPFMRNRITGHEDSMSVWAPGVDAMGDGSDRLVTLDVNPASARHGKLIDTESVGRPGEANQMMFGANAIKAADEPADDTGRARV